VQSARERVDSTNVTSLVLGALGVVTVVASFAFSLAVLVVTHRPEVLQRRSAPVAPPAVAAEPEKAPEAATAPTDTTENADPVTRVLGDIERLAALRDRGALTEKEFSAQKAKLLVNPASPRARRPQRTS